MHPDKYLELAEELNRNFIPLEEAKIRTAVSRAYYFIFLKIRSNLENSGHIFFSAQESHKEVTDALRRIPDKDASNIASLLDSLKSKRNEADYDLGIPRFDSRSERATMAIGEAKKISNRFDSIDKKLLKAKT